MMGRVPMRFFLFLLAFLNGWLPIWSFQSIVNVVISSRAERPAGLCNSFARSTPRTTCLHVLHDRTVVPSPFAARDRGPPKGGDMAYTKETIDRQTDTYKKIRQAGGVDCVRDVYARVAPQNAFFYVGKLALCSTTTVDAALSRQWNLIEEHACRLRPVELGRAFGRIELFSAPGDTELLCSQNEIPLQRVHRLPKTTSSASTGGGHAVSLLEAGFLCEYVTNKGKGFFLHRNSDGSIPTSNEGAYEL